MGRYKRKKHLYSDKQTNGTQSTSKTNGAEGSTEFTTAEKRRMREYLSEFRSGALRVLDEGSTTPAKKEFCIAGIRLPKLTLEVLSQPYLALPAELAFRQRQFVHDCCRDLLLYHIGLGSHGTSGRWIAVSIFCDVFEGVDGFEIPAYLGFHRAYKPWYCRHHNFAFREEHTKSFKSKIQALLDQPSACLREDLDTLNFYELDEQDLSQVPRMGEEVDDASQFMLVDTAEKMKQCIAELKAGKPTELGFDVEAYNPSKYCQQTCLLQLASSHGKEYVIDVLAEGVWDTVGGLAPFFADPNIVKVGHSIGGLDARCLHRDFGIFFCNVFDTYEAARVLNLPSHGLAAVCEYYALDTDEYAALKDIYQTTDWRHRPLTEPMIRYGRYDVHYLLKLRWLMMRDLTHSELFLGGEDEGKLVAESLAATLQRIHDFEDGVEFESGEFETASEGDTISVENGDGDRGMNGGDDTDDGYCTAMPGEEEDDGYDAVKTTKIAPVNVLRMQPRLMRVLSVSQDRCLDLWAIRAEPHYRNPVFLSHMKRTRPNKSKGKLNQPQELTPSQIHLYEDLVRLRKNIAQREECLAGFICSLDDLARIAIGRPTNAEALRIISYFMPESLDGMVAQIFALTTQSLRADKVRVSPLDAVVRRRRKRSKGLETTGKVVLASIFFGAIYMVVVTMKKKRPR